MFLKILLFLLSLPTLAIGMNTCPQDLESKLLSLKWGFKQSLFQKSLSDEIYESWKESLKELESKNCEKIHNEVQELKVKLVISKNINQNIESDKVHEEKILLTKVNFKDSVKSRSFEELENDISNVDFNSNWFKTPSPGVISYPIDSDVSFKSPYYSTEVNSSQVDLDYQRSLWLESWKKTDPESAPEKLNSKEAQLLTQYNLTHQFYKKTFTHFQNDLLFLFLESHTLLSKDSSFFDSQKKLTPKAKKNIAQTFCPKLKVQDFYNDIANSYCKKEIIKYLDANNFQALGLNYDSLLKELQRTISEFNQIQNNILKRDLKLTASLSSKLSREERDFVKIEYSPDFNDPITSEAIEELQSYHHNLPAFIKILLHSLKIDLSLNNESSWINKKFTYVLIEDDKKPKEEIFEEWFRERKKLPFIAKDISFEELNLEVLKTSIQKIRTDITLFAQSNATKFQNIYMQARKPIQKALSASVDIETALIESLSLIKINKHSLVTTIYSHPELIIHMDKVLNYLNIVQEGQEKLRKNIRAMNIGFNIASLITGGIAFTGRIVLGTIASRASLWVINSRIASVVTAIPAALTNSIDIANSYGAFLDSKHQRQNLEYFSTYNFLKLEEKLAIEKELRGLKNHSLLGLAFLVFDFFLIKDINSALKAKNFLKELSTDSIAALKSIKKAPKLLKSQIKNLVRNKELKAILKSSNISSSEEFIIKKVIRILETANRNKWSEKSLLTIFEKINNNPRILLNIEFENMLKLNKVSDFKVLKDLKRIREIEKNKEALLIKSKEKALENLSREWRKSDFLMDDKQIAVNFEILESYFKGHNSEKFVMELISNPKLLGEHYSKIIEASSNRFKIKKLRDYLNSYMNKNKLKVSKDIDCPKVPAFLN